MRPPYTNDYLVTYVDGQTKVVTGGSLEEVVKRSEFKPFESPMRRVKSIVLLRALKMPTRVGESAMVEFLNQDYPDRTAALPR